MDRKNKYIHIFVCAAHLAKSPVSGQTTESIRIKDKTVEGPMKMRQWITGIAAGAVLGLGLASPASAQQNFENVEIKTQKVADGIYMLVGQGGNIGLSVGADGAFMIDDQFAPLTDKIQAAVADVSDHSVEWVLNTHYHPDHAGGNERWGEMGAYIVAHDNVRERLAAGLAENENATETSLPIVTFNDEMTFHWNGEEITIHHIPHAHTDGDVFIHFMDSNVIHGGDVVNMASYPFIDTNAGGSFRGYMRGLARIISVADENTRIIPGHGSLSERGDLQAQLDMLREIQNEIQTAKTAGHSLEDVQAMDVTAEYDDRWSGFVTGEQIVEVIYNAAP